MHMIADIGGGIGTQLASILDAAPSPKGILFDQPHLKSEAISHDRMEVVSGNFFESVPRSGDAYLLRWILHDWADPQALGILRTWHRSIKPTASLILVESLIPEAATFDFSKWTDLQMLVATGGLERTVAEYRALLSAAGFDLQEMIATGGSWSSRALPVPPRGLAPSFIQPLRFDARPRTSTQRQLCFFRIFSVQAEHGICKLLIIGGRYWDRTSGPCRVKAVLYR
jgi:O-methyltransferase domain